MDEAALARFIQDKIRQWKQSQTEKKDGYDYEESLVKMVDEIGKEIFQESIGPLPADRKKKKTSHPLWRNNSSDRSFFESISRKLCN